MSASAIASELDPNGNRVDPAEVQDYLNELESSAALDIDENNRYFHDPGHANRLGHQGKTTTGGSTHGTRPGDPGRRCRDG